MKSVNKVILVGNVGSDPTVRTAGASKVAEFSLATGRQWTNQRGEKQEKTEWHRVIAWKGLAEVVEKYVSKGSPLYVEGEIEYRSYEKEGTTRYVTEIRAFELVLLGGGSGASKPTKQERSYSSYSSDPTPFPEPDDDDSLPF